MSNRKIGDDFEVEFASILAANGFWVHRLKQNSAGQPFDIIAVRNGYAAAIDCKVCEKDVFEISRVEENQANAMTLWSDCGNGRGWFAVKFSDETIFMLSFAWIEYWEKYFGSRMTRQTIEHYGEDLHDWIQNQ